MSYASGTSVSEDRSRQEIERNLRKFAGDDFDEFVYRSSREEAAIGFKLRGLHFVIAIKMPSQSEYSKTPTGKDRKANAAFAAWEQECRRRWRSLSAVVKAKLVAIDDGVATFESEFMPYILLGNGQTLASQIAPAIERAAESGGPLLLEDLSSK